VVDPRPSRRDHLSELAAAGINEMAALQRLAAWHAESSETEMPLRREAVGAGEHIFPLPDVLPMLTIGALGVVKELMEACESESDQLLVATFGMYLVTAVHPFDDANGRVAFDFGQYLLMKAWEEKAPPLFYESDTHDVLGHAFAPLDGDTVATSGEELGPAMVAMLKRIGEISLPELWTMPPLVGAAHFLAEGSRLPFTARVS
jgi:hypothetical protein